MINNKENRAALQIWTAFCCPEQATFSWPVDVTYDWKCELFSGAYYFYTNGTSAIAFNYDNHHVYVYEGEGVFRYVMTSAASLIGFGFLGDALYTGDISIQNGHYILNDSCPIGTTGYISGDGRTWTPFNPGNTFNPGAFVPSGKAYTMAIIYTAYMGGIILSYCTYSWPNDYGGGSYKDVLYYENLNTGEKIDVTDSIPHQYSQYSNASPMGLTSFGGYIFLEVYESAYGAFSSLIYSKTHWYRSTDGKTFELVPPIDGAINPNILPGFMELNGVMVSPEALGGTVYTVKDNPYAIKSGVTHSYRSRALVYDSGHHRYLIIGNSYLLSSSDGLTWYENTRVPGGVVKSGYANSGICMPGGDMYYNPNSWGDNSDDRYIVYSKYRPVFYES